MRKNSPGKWRHLEYFTRQEDGKYAYSGSHMICAMEPEEYRRLCLRLLTISGGLGAMLTAAGCFPRTGMEGNAFLLLPYVAELAASLLLSWSLFQMSRGGTKLRRYQYEKTVYAASRRAAEGLAASVAGAGGWILSAVLHLDNGRGAASILLKLSCIAGAVGFFVIYRQCGKISWKEEAASERS